MSDCTVFRSNVLLCRFLGKSALQISYSHHPCVAVCVCICVNVCCQVAKIVMKQLTYIELDIYKSPVFLLELDLHFHGKTVGQRV